MNLKTATQLLEGSGKHFSDVYKLYQYKDDQLLREYLDFVIHEPVEWMRGFPKRLKSKGMFAQPKTALIKLLKMKQIVDEFGEDYVKTIYDVVWQSFKKHGDDVYAARNPHMSPLEEYMEAESVDDSTGPSLHLEIDDDDVSVHSLRLRKSDINNELQHKVVDWKARCHVLENVIRNIVKDLSPGLAAGFITLLDTV